MPYRRWLSNGVNGSAPARSKTFDEYVTEKIISKVKFYSSKYKRTDIVFDVYRQPSLKAETRSKRGNSVRRRVSANNKIPSNWRSFLRDGDNKTELFNFIADKISRTTTTNVVVVTKGENALTNQPMSLDDLSPCNHEEADSRIFVHARDVVKKGSTSIMIKANDTDVVVIAVSVMLLLMESGLEQL
jgi:hypothetical protein